MSFRRFEDELAAEMKSAERQIWNATKEIANIAFSKIVFRTPVDTGFARNSWFVELGDGATQEQNVMQQLPQTRAIIENAPLFTPITIANGAEYIEALENGHSGQAPNGMVQVTADELRSRFRGFVR